MLDIIFLLIIFLFSVIIHEIAHGSVALWLGDPTAKYAGRLTLNPLKHLDPLGSFILPLFLVLSGSGIIFGWAKPVPINPYNFRDQKYGEAKVALAGPGANLLIALVFALPLRFSEIPSLLPGLYLMFSYIVYINLLIAVFNLTPVPPLDGSHLLFTFLPYSLENLKRFLTQFSTIILFFIIFFFFPLIYFVVSQLFTFICGCPLPF